MQQFIWTLFICFIFRFGFFENDLRELEKDGKCEVRILFDKCYFLMMNHHIRRLVWSDVSHNFLKGREITLPCSGRGGGLGPTTTFCKHQMLLFVCKKHQQQQQTVVVVVPQPRDLGGGDFRIYVMYHPKLYYFAPKKVAKAYKFTPSTVDLIFPV